MVKLESIQGAVVESEQELTHELTAVRAQLQQVVSRLGSSTGILRTHKVTSSQMA